MKSIRVLLALFSILAITYSCSKDINYEEIGDYHFQYTVKFDSKGGEKSVIIKDNMKYRAHFEVGFDEMILLEFTRELVNPIHPKGERDLIDGEWYHGVIPDKGTSTMAIISADRNPSNKERTATIEGETLFSDEILKMFRIIIIQKQLFLRVGNQRVFQIALIYSEAFAPGLEIPGTWGL